jgi:glycosyltransferase involved in cell wall biosynthesis
VNNPIVSIVMSVCNGAKHLDAAIESMLRQSFARFEFIIVNDGSTDQTGKIIERWAIRDSRIKILTNGARCGLTVSLNRALKSASGAWIARQDADDLSDENRLARQWEFLEANPGVLLAGTAYRNIDDSGLELNHVYPPNDDLSLRWNLVFHNCFAHASTMFKRIVEGMGCVMYDESFPFAQDYELWTRLAAHGRIANIGELLISRRIHSSMISERHVREQLICSQRVCRREINRYGDFGLQSEADLEQLRFCYCATLPLTSRRDVEFCRAILDLLIGFSRSEGLTRAEEKTLRRIMIQRWLSSFPARNFGAVHRSGLLGLIMRRDPLALMEHLDFRFRRRLRISAIRDNHRSEDW